MIKIAIDAMGGDFAPLEIIKGVNLAVEKHDDIELVLFGNEEEINKHLVKNSRVSIVHTEHFLDMGLEDPIKEFRTNPNHSMFMAMKVVKDGEADAVVSAGPTQALVVGGHFILRRIKGMKRVAIAPFIPDFEGRQRILLDSGANVDFKPEHLLDFAIVASIVAKSYLGIENPKVGLVNIGSEPGKGRAEDLEAYKLMKESPLVNFIGNIEPKEILSCDVDVLVTDGFTGNILMKSYEGAISAFSKAIRSGVDKSFKAKVGGLLMKGVFSNLKENTNAEKVGGAILVGVNGVLIKAHGSSNGYAFYNAIRQAKLLANANIIEKITEAIEETHKND